jgi:hypothetical protein
MATPEEKKGHNEAVFRDANETLEQRADQIVEGDQGTPVPFLCECTRLDCTKVALLTLAEYEHVRAHGNRGFVIPGHEDTAVERIVEEHAGYLITEKFGTAGEIVRESDPRR